MGILKYRNKRTERAGHSFASKAEALLFDYLKIKEMNGEIKDLRAQISVYLTKARIQYKPDFEYFDIQKSEMVWAEMKGFETPSWRIKKKLWPYYGPGTLLIYGCSNGRIFFSEEIRHKGAFSET